MSRELKIFISHTGKDKYFCDNFDGIVARVGISAFRSEYEYVESPAWKRINREINESIAFFLLVGEELVNSQKSNDEGWRYTQNWIAYEVGVAAHAGKDLWVICDNVPINFPVPYLNNYLTTSALPYSWAYDYLRAVLESYKSGKTYPYPYVLEDLNLSTVCPHNNCGIEFNLHDALEKGSSMKCPVCLRDIIFADGHPL